ncbi:type IV toxin-antitoxin system AbiEi family antitoxin domain-containing protein [Williamsia sp. M5A3_1d]
MRDLPLLITPPGGVVSRAQLIAIGVDDASVRRLIRTGELHRLRPGWFASPWADPQVVEAVRAGGVLTCLAALRRHGLWVPEDRRRLHVRAAHRGSRIPDACRLHGPIPPPTSAVDDLLCALRHAVLCLDAEGLVVLCDSALNTRLATGEELATALSAAPSRIRSLLDRCDPAAQSGTETMVRLRLRSQNIAVTVQPLIDGVGFVDLLVGERLVIECDSLAHHTGLDGYENDRARDRTLIALGYLPMRLSYRQIVHEWPTCNRAILDVVRRGDHH